MKRSYGFFRGLLWVIGGYHILAGLLFNGPRPWLVRVAETLGATRMPDEAAFYLVKPFGIYLLLFGLAMCAAAWNPIKNRTLITLGVLLFGLRIIQRLSTLSQTQDLFGISAARNGVMLAIIALFGILLAVFRLKLLKEADPDRAGAHG